MRDDSHGDVEVAFERAPTEPTSFKTANGALDVTFPANLAGELEFATMQGEVFTDFDVEPLQQPPTVQDGRTRGRFRMRTGSETAFRVGAGGARHSFHTLNGDIYVRKASQ